MRRLVAILAALVVVCAPVSAGGGGEKETRLYNLAPWGAVCSEREPFERVLFDTYRETLTEYGLIMTARGRAIIGVYRSTNGTFTISLTSSNGVSCLVVAGKHWRVAKPPGKL